MCGICGIVSRTGGPVDPARLVRMRDCMISRGPDDEGLLVRGPVGLGHRRLSIVDLSAAGHQPMANEDESVWIVYNGEIYNFPELRQELESAGHRFVSRTDTEVLIHGYEEWGIDGLCRRIAGMFAFAIWDVNQRRLWLARDRLGKKPLFYYDDGRELLFSSTLRSLWLALGGRLEIDPCAVDEFLFKYVIDQDRCVFSGVRKLAPGCFAETGLDSGVPRPQRYWSISYARKRDLSESEWVEAVDAALERAVRRRLIADVPIGAFLSGGVDSSGVVAMMARVMDQPVRTFTVGFEFIKSYDERQYARKVAERTGSDHRELILDPDVWSMLPRLVWEYGEPFGDSSAIPSWFVAQAARRHVTVALTGDGGDEGFAGYDVYRAAYRAIKYRWVPAPIRCHALPLAAGLLSAVAPTALISQRVGAFAHYLAGRVDRVAAISTCWSMPFRKRLYSPSLMRSLDGFDPAASRMQTVAGADGPTPVDKALALILHHELPSDYLTKVDVATMAHSLEARCPFLDTELLELASTIPAEVLVRNGEAKALLKKVVARLVPPDVVYRRKWGFGIPVGHWFRDHWRERVRNLLLSQRAGERGLFNMHYLERVLDQHAAGKVNHNYRIWSLLVLEIWHRLFVDRTLRPEEPAPIL